MFFLKNPLEKTIPPLRNQDTGGVAEWSIASVLKTEVGQPTVGSNPTPSANTPAQLVWVGVLAFQGWAENPLSEAKRV